MLVSCAKVSHKTMDSIPGGKTSQTRALTTFNQIKVQGRMNVDLHTGYSKPMVILRGDSRDLMHVKTEVKNNQLLVYLANPLPKFGPVSIEIRTKALNDFNYAGEGNITGSQINSSGLELHINNSAQTTLGGSYFLRRLDASGGGLIQLSGLRSENIQFKIQGKTSVQLVGEMNMSSIDLDGEGRLSMYWVKANQLTICERGKTVLQMAGIANKMIIELWGTSQFKGRFMRGRNVFVRTHDRSVADIMALLHQHTLATDASDIYFYNLPRTRADFMAYDGSVLDMRDWNQYALQEYDRYNK